MHGNVRAQSTRNGVCCHEGGSSYLLLGEFPFSLCDMREQSSTTRVLCHMEAREMRPSHGRSFQRLEASRGTVCIREVDDALLTVASTFCPLGIRKAMLGG